MISLPIFNTLDSLLAIAIESTQLAYAEAVGVPADKGSPAWVELLAPYHAIINALAERVTNWIEQAESAIASKIETTDEGIAPNTETTAIATTEAEFDFESPKFAPDPEREQKAQALKVERLGESNQYKVFNPAKASDYHADLDAGTCTCPDYEHRGTFCKHLIAAANFEAAQPPQPKKRDIRFVDRDVNNLGGTVYVYEGFTLIGRMTQTLMGNWNHSLQPRNAKAFAQRNVCMDDLINTHDANERTWKNTRVDVLSQFAEPELDF